MIKRNADRTPSKGDRVCSAPGVENADQFEGKIASVTEGHLVVVSAKGTIQEKRWQMPRRRFTWSLREKAWLCWPLKLLNLIKDHERADLGIVSDAVRGAFASMGDYVWIENGAASQGGWISGFTYTTSYSVTGPMGALLDGYEIATREGMLIITADLLEYHPEKEFWIARISRLGPIAPGGSADFGVL